MGRVVTYYCDRCGLSIPIDKGAQIFCLFAEDYSREYNIFTKLICEKCIDDLTVRWMQEGGDHDE